MTETATLDSPDVGTAEAVLGPDHYALRAHPLVPLPTAEEAAAFLSQPDGAAALTKLLNDRGMLIWLMETQPERYGADLPHWKDADRDLADCQMLYASGGKRASKSEWAAKRMVESMLTYPGGLRWAFQDNVLTSVATQQRLIWKYLPADIKALNGRRAVEYKVNYSKPNGFANGQLILPNGSELYFLTYNQEVEDFQGWELGARVRRLSARRDGTLIQNLGAWPDENLTVKWLDTLKFRLATRGAKMIWTFSTTDGITATIKKFLGTARTLESRPSPLLADRVNVPGLPAGHMPYRQLAETPGARVIYFFTHWNPFSGYDEPGGVKEICAGKSSAYIKMNAYGYAEDVGMRACANFGEWNIIRPELLPAEGTNYFCTDPHGAWNWAMAWVRVAPGNPASFYIYRDWPDYRRYGEWAVQSDDPRTFDGDKGPAQKRSLGYGPTEYKQLILREETIGANERDPYRKRLWAETHPDGEDVGAERQLSPTGPTGGNEIRERIAGRYIDPRAGRSQHATEKGGICLIDKLRQVDRHPKTGELVAPGMEFIAAPGLHIGEGMAQIQSVLYWDREKELMPLINYPKLFVSEDCRQMIWALANYTGEDGESGACKAWLDILRYLLTAGIRHIAPGRVKTSGGGSY